MAIEVHVNPAPREWFEQISMDVSKQSSFDNHSSEACLAKIGNTIFRVFRRSAIPSHQGDDGDAYFQKSTDGGRTWTTPVPAYVDAGNDIRNYSFGAIGSKLFLFFRKSDGVTPTVDVGYITSDDEGATWSAFTSVESLVTVGNKIPYGDFIVNGSTVYVAFYSGGACQWIKTADAGTTWTDDGVKFTSAANYSEPSFVFINSTDVVGLVRTIDSPFPHMQVESTDGGATFSAPIATNLNNGKDLETGTSLYYDAAEDLLMTIADNRDNTRESDIKLYVNKASEVFGNPTNWRLISTQKNRWQKTNSYGYPKIIKVDTDKYHVSYSERYRYDTIYEVANIFQFEINSNLGVAIVSPTIDENYRVKSPTGLWESRYFDKYEFNEDVLFDINERDVARWDAQADVGDFRDFGLDQLKIIPSLNIASIPKVTRAIVTSSFTGKPAGSSNVSIVQSLGWSGSSGVRLMCYDFENEKIYTCRRPGDPWYQLLTTKDLEVGYTAPASPTAPGRKGEIRMTANYTYTCIATNTWKRTATDDTWT